MTGSFVRAALVVMAFVRVPFVRAPFFLALLACAVVSPRAPVALAAGDVLSQQRPRHPLGALVGVPAPASRGDAPSEWQVALEHGNAFAGGSAGGETLLLDGETTELELRHRRRLGECWSGEVAVPFLHHAGGIFDGPIQHWHDAFGLPNAGRERVPEDRLDFTWTDADGDRLSLRSDAGGIGDVTLSVQRAFGCRADPFSGATAPRDDRTILRFGLKLPTGSIDDWTGSGGVGGWVDAQSPVIRPVSRVRLGASLGAFVSDGGELVGDPEPIVAFGAFGARIEATRNVSLVLDLGWNSPLFDSELPEIGRGAAQLATGLVWSGRRSSFEFTILEDVLVDASTDIVARLVYRREG